jgi:DNA-binding NtrC family response regulator
MNDARKLRAVLAIFDSHDERTALQTILVRTGYTVRHVSTVDEVAPVFSQGRVGIVFSENRLPDGRSWRDVLARLQELPHPPPLIVADRLADEALWAEVLNLGAYDLLSEPFDPTEVTRVIELAWFSWENRASHTPQLARKPSRSERTTPSRRASDCGT